MTFLWILIWLLALLAVSILGLVAGRNKSYFEISVLVLFIAIWIVWAPNMTILYALFITDLFAFAFAIGAIFGRLSK